MLLLFACDGVLGLEDARLDPLLSDAGADAPKTLCEDYCDTVLDACPADDQVAVYDSRLGCLNQCDAFDEGEAEAQTGNSVQCRLSHARLAKIAPGERPTECPAAGPGGNDVCGSNCESYCTLMARFCPESFASPQACQDSCDATPDLGGFQINQTTGASVQCRLYHLSAAVFGPALHCPHAAGAPPCTDE